ncbi:MAG: GNAT family N-acetyltransferase [Clostridia bacterium]|nr:GNAT family N-acetyltransferase [Clostridia bacterium]
MIKFVSEIELNTNMEEEITELLQEAFSDFPYPKRSYYKQKPHYRLVYVLDNQVVGYVGLDYRVMVLNDELCNVLGIIDLSVKKSHRHRGIATEMLTYIKTFAFSHRVDTLMLFADDKRLYEHQGYKSYGALCTLLMIDEHKTLGIKTAFYEELMLLAIHKSIERLDQVDLLGYLY